MSHVINVFISLQQTDLHCVSALEALRYSIGFTELTQLRRLRKISFMVDVDNKPGAIDCVKRCVNESFDLVNPNKETVYFDELPELPGTGWYGIQVTANEAPLRSVSSLSFASHPKIISAEQGLQWLLKIDSSDSSEQVMTKIDTFCGPTTSVNRGLLVNSLFETYLIQSIS
ncbi:hypothetical protein EB093_03820 [bacterium]|nr:hypothetical protein [bacterium]